MDLERLSQAYYLKKEIAIYQEQLQDLWDMASPGAVSMDGMPSTHGNGSKVENLVLQIEAMTEKIHNKQQELLVELQDLTDWIMRIPDSHLRLVFVLRFLNALSWQEVADALGGKNTEDSCKKMVYRYLNSLSEE